MTATYGVQAGLNVGGTVTWGGLSNADTITWAAATVTDLIVLDGATHVQLCVWQNAPTAKNMFNGERYTYIQGWMIGRV
jgi:hypothetical protein